MPIEIKELHIKAVVGGNNQPANATLPPQEVSKLKKEITREVTNKVMRLLRQKNER
jgi:hypothetical protein